MSLTKKDLVAIEGTFFYDVGVKNPEVWRAIGAELRSIRLGQGWSSTKELADAKGRPDQKTMDRIEKGRPGQMGPIDAYCDALGVALVDVLRSVLPDAQWTAGALRVASGFDALKSTPRLQKLMTDLAEIGLDAQGRPRDSIPDASTEEESPPSTPETDEHRARKRRRRKT